MNLQEQTSEHQGFTPERESLWPWVSGS